MQIKVPDTQFIDQLSERTIPLRMDYLSSGTKVEHLPPLDVPEIAIVGRSNVGKSSLINFLAGQKTLARVSSTPGRTQMVNLFSVEGGRFIFADLPGFGFAASSKAVQAQWQGGMEGYFKGRENLIGVLFLVDVRREIVPEDTNLCAWLQDLGLIVLAIQTKCDKVHKSKLHMVRLAQAKALGVAPGMIISTSVQDRVGLDAVCRGLAGMLHGASDEDA